MTNDTDDRWEVSTEGDLDPDLTEEAGYGEGEPTGRSAWWLVYRIGLALGLAAMIGSALAVFLR
jgi:hypothetical protein